MGLELGRGPSSGPPAGDSGGGEVVEVHGTYIGKARVPWERRPVHVYAELRTVNDLNDPDRTRETVDHRRIRAGDVASVAITWEYGTRAELNRGDGSGGAGIDSAVVERRGQDPGGASVVQLCWEFRGAELLDAVFRMRRRVWTEDPTSLTARMFYEVEVTSEGEKVSDTRGRVLAVLGAAGIEGLTVQQIGDGLAVDGQGRALHKRTIQRVVGELLEDGQIDGEQGDPNRPGRWWLT